jgi:hypothetical protein
LSPNLRVTDYRMMRRQGSLVDVWCSAVRMIWRTEASVICRAVVRIEQIGNVLTESMPKVPGTKLMRSAALLCVDD